MIEGRLGLGGGLREQMIALDHNGCRKAARNCEQRGLPGRRVMS